MARVRYVGPGPVTVPELNHREVQPDEVAEVPDDRYWGYACQTTNWESVEEPPGFVIPGSEPEIPPAQDVPAPTAAETPPAQDTSAPTAVEAAPVRTSTRRSAATSATQKED